MTTPRSRTFFKSIRHTLLFTLVVMLCLVSAITLLFAPTFVHRLTDAYLDSITHYVESQVRFPLLIGDPVALDERMQAIANFPWISGGAIARA